MNILLFDTETSGLNPQRSFIISNGAILWNTETNEKSEFYEVLNWKKIVPNFTIPKDTIDVHGITDEIMELEGIHPLDSMNNFYKWIKDFIKNDNINVCVAFNLPYDLNMYFSNLKYLIEKHKNINDFNFKIENINNLLSLLDKNDQDYENKTIFIDSMIVDQIFHFEVDGEKVRHDLDSVGNRYGFFSDPNAHNAISDTRRTFNVFKLQLQEIKEKGLNLDQNFEDRLIKKYNRNQNYWKKKNGLDYLGKNMGPVFG